VRKEGVVEKEKRGEKSGGESKNTRKGC